MTALMMEIFFCLLPALLLGLLIGWLLVKAIKSKKHNEEVERLHHTIEDKNKYILKLEKEYVIHHQLEKQSSSNDEYEKAIGEYQKRILALEEELTFYRRNGEEDELIISKDQFTQIEKQLIAYQQEIKALKERN